MLALSPALGIGYGSGAQNLSTKQPGQEPHQNRRLTPWPNPKDQPTNFDDPVPFENPGALLLVGRVGRVGLGNLRVLRF